MAAVDVAEAVETVEVVDDDGPTDEDGDDDVVETNLNDAAQQHSSALLWCSCHSSLPLLSLF